MANPEHLKILLEGVEVWNQWREDNPEVIPDLSEANLSEANLLRADLREANLSGTNLIKADLRLANLIDANISRAILIGADLDGADLFLAELIGADLSKAILSEAMLSEANLSEANLSGADLYTARLIDTKLDGATLTGARLWEAQRARWSIKGVICEYVYWDENGKEVSDYSPGEFERLFADKTKVRLFYKDGVSPLEIATIPALIKLLEDSHPGVALRLVSIHEDSGGVVVELAIEDAGDQSPEQLKQLSAEIKITAQHSIEFERKFLADQRQRLQLEETQLETGALSVLESGAIVKVKGRDDDNNIPEPCRRYITEIAELKRRAVAGQSPYKIKNPRVLHSGF
jgi:hypothetical protein